MQNLFIFLCITEDYKCFKNIYISKIQIINLIKRTIDNTNSRIEYKSPFIM